jgi:hypothetical protein
MMPMIAMQIGLLACLLLAVLAGAGFLIAALVVYLAAILGLSGALALTGLGLFLVAAALALVMRRQARAAQARHNAMASTAALAEIAVLLLPRTFQRRLKAGVAAGLGIAALIALLVQTDRKSDD